MKISMIDDNKELSQNENLQSNIFDDRHKKESSGLHFENQVVWRTAEINAENFVKTHKNDDNKSFVKVPKPDDAKNISLNVETRSYDFNEPKGVKVPKLNTNHSNFNTTCESIQNKAERPESPSYHLNGVYKNGVNWNDSELNLDWDSYSQIEDFPNNQIRMKKLESRNLERSSLDVNAEKTVTKTDNKIINLNIKISLGGGQIGKANDFSKMLDLNSICKTINLNVDSSHEISISFKNDHKLVVEQYEKSKEFYQRDRINFGMDYDGVFENNTNVNFADFPETELNLGLQATKDNEINLKRPEHEMNSRQISFLNSENNEEYANFNNFYKYD